MSEKKKLSGAENRKRAAQKQIQEDSFLKKVQKINTVLIMFFLSLKLNRPNKY